MGKGENKSHDQSNTKILKVPFLSVSRKVSISPEQRYPPGGPQAKNSWVLVYYSEWKMDHWEFSDSLVKGEKKFWMPSFVESPFWGVLSELY